MILNFVQVLHRTFIFSTSKQLVLNKFPLHFNYLTRKLWNGLQFVLQRGEMKWATLKFFLLCLPLLVAIYIARYQPTNFQDFEPMGPIFDRLPIPQFWTKRPPLLHGRSWYIYVWLCIKETGCGSPKGVFHRGGGFHPPLYHPRNQYVVTNRVKPQCFSGQPSGA